MSVLPPRLSKKLIDSTLLKLRCPLYYQKDSKKTLHPDAVEECDHLHYRTQVLTTTLCYRPSGMYRYMSTVMWQSDINFHISQVKRPIRKKRLSKTPRGEAVLTSCASIGSSMHNDPAECSFWNSLGQSPQKRDGQDNAQSESACIEKEESGGEKKKKNPAPLKIRVRSGIL